MSTENPVVLVAAFNEALKGLVAEIRGLVAESFAFQLQMMELLPEADRITAFKAVLEAHQTEVASDERVALALLSTVEKLGAAAAAVIPPVLALRQERAAAASTAAAARDSLEAMRQANDDAAQRRQFEEAERDRRERDRRERSANSKKPKYYNGFGGIE